MAFFDDNTSIRLHKEQKDILAYMRKKYSMIFKSDSDVIRIAINYYFNNKVKRGELDEFELDK